MTLSGIEEDTHVEGHVAEEVVPEDCDVLQERDFNKQRASEDASKESTIKDVDLELAHTHETQRDTVG